ncbi:hypothetical protein [Candidatus Harpocratesius sp.]
MNQKKQQNSKFILVLVSFILIGGIIFSFQFHVISQTNNQKSNNTKNLDNTSNFLNQLPQSSESTNIWISLSPINNSHIYRGENITLSGHIFWFNAPQLLNLTNYPVFPVVNGVAYNGLNGNANLSVLTDANGNFTIHYTIPHTIDYNTNITIYANITEDPSNNIYVGPETFLDPPKNIDVLATSLLSITTNIVDPVLTNDQYSILITLTDDNAIPLSASNVSLYRNGNLSDVLQSGINIDNTGQVQLSITQEAGLSSLGVYYSGVNFTTEGSNSFYQIAPSNYSIPIPHISSVSADLVVTNAKNSSESGVYTGDDIQIQATLWFNNNTNLPLNNRQISITLNVGNQTANLGPYLTDSKGEILQTINLASNGITVNGTLSVSISVLNGGETVIDSSSIQNNGVINIAIFDEPNYGGNLAANATIQAPAKNWIGILVPVGIAALVIGGIVVFQRYRMEQTHRRSIKLRKIDLEKFAIMNLLFKVDRRREAIAYSYKIFADLINEKYGLMREKNQTLREFAILCVTKYGLDPLRTYPYIALVENVTYGAYDLTPEEYERSMKVFARIFQEITGTVLNFALEVTPETEMMEGVTLKIGGD